MAAHHGGPDRRLTGVTRRIITFIAVAMRLRTLTVAAALVAAALVAASRVAAAQSVAADTTTFAFAGVAFSPSLGVDLTHSTRVGAGAYVRDIAPGTGAPIRAGAMVTLFMAVHLPDGTAVEIGDHPRVVQMLPGQFVSGVDAGLRGMREGGRRQIIIPARSAYGHQGAGLVPPDSPLVVDVRIGHAS